MSSTEKLAEVEAAIPHRKPMLLVDEIVERNDNSIRSTKTFSADDYFVQGHFPDYPLVPGVILCESALQTGAILLSSKMEGEGAVPVATRIDAVKFKKMVRPGDTIQIDVTLNDSVSNAYFMTGKVTVGGKLAARLDFACTVAEPN